MLTMFRHSVGTREGNEHTHLYDYASDKYNEMVSSPWTIARRGRCRALSLKGVHSSDWRLCCPGTQGKTQYSYWSAHLTTNDSHQSRTVERRRHRAKETRTAGFPVRQQRQCHLHPGNPALRKPQILCHRF